MNSNLFHTVLADLRTQEISGRTVLVGVSGGLDSMFLLKVLSEARPILELKITVAHVHHGIAETPEQTQFRNQARDFVKEAANSYQCAFITNAQAPGKVLSSEDSLRKFRYGCFHHFLKEPSLQGAILTLAHHREDLLETRLIRLIRGTGAQGLQSMALDRTDLVRPLLRVSREEILHEAKACGLQWLEDPSNAQGDPLRNWVRDQWLPLLEQKRPGSVRTLGQSLQLVAEALQCPSEGVNFPDILNKKGISRSRLEFLRFTDKKRVIAHYLRELGLKSYSRGHVMEILKRLDTRQKNFTFQMLGCEWKVTPDLVRASRDKASQEE